jgi:acyl-CoA dehydrogenase
MRSMHFDHSAKVSDLQRRLSAFMDEHVYPNERRITTRSRTAIDGSRRPSSRS